MNEYFIVSKDAYGEELFLRENGRWTSFLTDAKSFNNENDARNFAIMSTYSTDYEIKRY